METREVQQILANASWPITVDGLPGTETFWAVTAFQEGYSAAHLHVDGIAGPQTTAALSECAARSHHTSEHFTFREFASKGNGWIRLRRELVLGLEVYRDRLGQPVHIASGYRDTDHNQLVGGATNSRHLHGEAADLYPRLTLEQVRALGVFSGIGVVRATQMVTHVDVRGIPAGSPPTPRTVLDPEIWYYG